MGNLQSDRENTGNFKMKFKWVPCLVQSSMILNMKDIARFAATFFKLFRRMCLPQLHMKQSRLIEIGTGQNLWLDREKN